MLKNISILQFQQIDSSFSIANSIKTRKTTIIIYIVVIKIE